MSLTIEEFCALRVWINDRTLILNAATAPPKGGKGSIERINASLKKFYEADLIAAKTLMSKSDFKKFLKHGEEKL